MEHQKESDFRIICHVAKEYLWNVPSVRSFFIPGVFMMLLSRYLESLVPNLLKDVSAAISSNGNLKWALFYFGIVSLVSVILMEMQSYVICKAGQIAYRNANKKAYRYFLDLEPQSFYNFGKGEIQNIISRRSQAVQDVIDVFTLNFIPTFLTLLFSSILLFWNVGLFPALIINFSVVVYAITTIEITNYRNEIRKKINEHTNKMANIQVDGLTNYETGLVHNNVEYEVKRYDKTLLSYERASTTLIQSLFLLNMAQHSTWAIQFLIVITVSSLGVMVERISADNLTLLFTVSSTISRSLYNFGFMYGKYKQAMINIRIESPYLIERRKEGRIECLEFSNNILAEDLAVEISNRVIFSGVNIEIKRGEKIAIVGKNGAGKSTLIRILLMLRRQTRGRIKIDGIDIRDLKFDSLRKMMTYVPQNVSLFEGTVMENIKYGNLEMKDEEVVELGMSLQLHESIQRLSGGYYTYVTDNGSGLSGGERQKIAILRAVASKAPIIVMDEPTASLDKGSEKDILTKLCSMNNLTVIAIVHNLELLNIFNRTLVVSEGSVKDLIPTNDSSILSSKCDEIDQ